jgi:hypothetical protein
VGELRGASGVSPVSPAALLAARDLAVSARLRLLADTGWDSVTKLRVSRLLRSQGRQARYDHFFRLQPVLDSLFLWKPSLLERRDTCILYLKLVTCMRSSDISSVLPHVYMHQSNAFIRTVAKGQRLRSFRINVASLFFIFRYYQACPRPVFPRLAMFECSTGRTPLGSQRVAKGSLRLMSEAGISTSCFKSHSLRGAAATHLLQEGAQPLAVRHRGGWLIAGDSFGLHYGRAHQSIPWELYFRPSVQWFLPPSSDLPGPLPVSVLFPSHTFTAGDCNLGAIPSPSAPKASEPEGEAGGRNRKVEAEEEGEGIGNAVVRILDSWGAVMLEKDDTCLCGRAARWEAAFDCPRCEKRLHVRCLHLCPCRFPYPVLTPAASEGKRRPPPSGGLPKRPRNSKP